MTDQANLPGEGNDGQPSGSETTPPAWTAQLEGDLKSHERLTQFENISEMGKALIDTEGRLQNSISVPGENATDAERAEFYQKLGRPEAADKYEFTKPDGLPEGMPYSQEMEAAYKQFAFDNGFSEKQAADLYGWYQDTVKQGFEQDQAQKQEATEKAINQLKDQWKGDAFKENTELAVRAFKKFGGDEAQKFIEETRIEGVSLGDHPTFLKIFAEIGKAIGDDTMTGDRGGGKDALLSDEDRAKQRFPATYKE